MLLSVVRPAAVRCCGDAGDVGGRAGAAGADGRDPVGVGLSGVIAGVGVGGRRVICDEVMVQVGVWGRGGGIVGGIFDLVPGDIGAAVARGGGPGQVDLPRLRGLRDGGREALGAPGGVCAAATAEKAVKNSNSAAASPYPRPGSG